MSDHVTPEEARRLATDSVRRVFASKHECSPEASRLGRQLIDALDSLAAQLEEAQKVIEALRAYRDEPLKANEPIDQGWVNLLAALSAYDEQVKR